jgi:hypothetical protein
MEKHGSSSANPFWATDIYGPIIDIRGSAMSV